MARLSKNGLVAKKVGMTRIEVQDGTFIPVTLLQVAQQQVTKIMEIKKDGYSGYQVGYQAKSLKNLNKADVHRLRKSGIEDNYSKFSEFRIPEDVKYELGTVLTAKIFDDASTVDVTGLSKGRGFQGAVKRWNASIGRMTHGSRFHRRPGSLGQCTSPGRVFKNKHQPGHMGDVNVTVTNMKVVDVDVENNIIALKGSVPGSREGFLELRESAASSKNKKA